MTMKTTRIRCRRCICDDSDKQCRGMSLAFSMLDDPRGGHVELPPRYAVCPPSSHQPTNSNAGGGDDDSDEGDYAFLHRMNGLRRAYFRHLLSPSSLSSRQQQQQGIDDPRFPDDSQYVAVHHFHPRVVRQVAEAAGHGRDTSTTTSAAAATTNNYASPFRVPWTMKRAEMKRLGIHVAQEDRVFGGNDKDDRGGDNHEDSNTEYYFVPNYPLEDAYQALKSLSLAERSSGDITTDVYQKAKQAIQAKQKQKAANKLVEAADDRRQEPAADPTQQRQEEEAAIIDEENVPRTAVPEPLATSATNNNTPKIEPPEADKELLMEGSGEEEVRMSAASSSEDDTTNNRAKPPLGPRLVDKETTERPTIPSTDITRSQAADFGDGDSADNDNGDDFGDSNAPMNASDATMNGSFSLLQTSNTRLLNNTGGFLASSNSTIVHTKNSKASQASLGASDSTVVGGAASISISNLYASTVSLQVTDPALQTSDSTFHGSDLTVRASGATPNKFHASDTTIEASNVSAAAAAAMRKPSQVDIDFPLEELPKRKSTIGLPRLESPREMQARRRSKATSLTTSMASSSRAAAAAAMEFPLEEVPRRRSEFLPSCETLNELSPTVTTGQRRTTMSPAITPPRPEGRKSSIRASIREEVNAVDATASISEAKETVTVIGAPVLLTQTPRAGADTRFARNDSETSKLNDCSPSTPKRMLSVREMDTSEDLTLPPTPAAPPQLPKKSIDSSPSTPRRMQSVRDLEDDSSFDDTVEEDMTPLKPTIMLSGERNESTSRARSKDELRRLDVLTHSTSDSSAAKLRRRSTTDMLSFLDSREKRSRETPLRSRSGSSQSSQGARRPPSRTKSAESTGPRRRRTHFLPRSSKSDSSSRPARRRSADTSLLAGRSRGDSMGGSSRKSKLGVSRTIDTTRRAMQQFSHDFARDQEQPTTRRGRRTPRRTNSSDSALRSRSGSPTRIQPPRRARSRLPPARTKSNSSNRSEMNRSSPAIMGNRSRTSAPNIASRVQDEMNHSSPAVLDQADVISRISSRRKTDPCPSLGTHSRESFAGGQPKRSYKAIASAQGGSTASEGIKDVTRHLASSRIANPSSCSVDVLSQPNHVPLATSGLVSSSDDSSLSNKSDLGSRALATPSARASMILVGALAPGNAEHTRNGAMESQTAACPGSLRVLDLGSDETMKEAPNHQSLNLEDLDERRRQAAKEVIPADFHFSYPLPDRHSKHKVDWELLGFFSLSPTEQRRYSENGNHPTTFSLPRRLVERKVRQQLMTEVVVMAHRRKSMAAKKQGGPEKAKRRDSTLFLKEIKATFQENQNSDTGFAKEVAKTAHALLEGDRIGRLSSSARSQGAFEESKGHVSLDLDQVFADSQDFEASQGQHLSVGKPKKAPAHQGSSMSLSLRRIFDESRLDPPDGDAVQQRSTEGEKTCQKKPEELRVLFPFKDIREKRKNGSAMSSNDILPEIDAPGTKVDESPAPDDTKQGSAASANAELRELFMRDPVASAKISVFTEKLLEISEEVADKPLSGYPNQLQTPKVLVNEYVPPSPPSLPRMPVQTAAKILETAHKHMSEAPKTEFQLQFQPPTSPSQESPTVSVDKREIDLSRHFPTPTTTSRQKAQSLRRLSQAGDNEDAAKASMAEFHLSFPPYLALSSRALPSTVDVGLVGPPVSTSSLSNTNILCGHDKLDCKIEQLRDIVVSPHHMFGDKKKEMKTALKRQAAKSSTVRSKPL